MRIILAKHKCDSTFFYKRLRKREQRIIIKVVFVLFLFEKYSLHFFAIWIHNNYRRPSFYSFQLFNHVGTFTDDEIRFGRITEDDHCWCELTAYDFETTDDDPTIGMSSDEVLKAFLAAKDNWDEVQYGLNGDETPWYPDVCYSLNVTDEKCVLIRWGEQGYYDPDFPVGFTKEQINELNSKMGISENEAEAMKICSMANISSDKWPEHYVSILEKLSQK